MKNSEELRQQLRSINRKSYPAYKGLKSLYHFGNYIPVSYTHLDVYKRQELTKGSSSLVK